MKIDVYQRIIDTAAQMFVKHGVKSITMNDIASETGVSKKTLYEYFANKEELLDKCVDSIWEQSQKEQDEIFSSGGVNFDSIHEMVREYAVRINSINPNFLMDIKKYHPNIWHNKIKKIDKEAIEFKAKMIKDGIKKGIIRPEINVEIASKLLHEQINMLMNSDVFPSDKYSRSEVFQTIVGVFIRGISTQKSLDELNKLDSNESNSRSFFSF